MKILVLGSDHRYREAVIRTIKVVYNRECNEYFEYVGDEYLDDFDEVLEMNVALV